MKLTEQLNNNVFFSFQTILLQLVFFALVSTGLEKPVGSISGQVSIEKPGFHLQFTNLAKHKVHITATGRDQQEERGVWANPDGSFRLDHLRTGEYSLKIGAYGFSTEYKEGVFVDDGEVTQLENPITLQISHPNIEIASNRRVFTSKSAPYFWLNCSGASTATVKLYKTDIIRFKKNIYDANEKLKDRSAISTNKGRTDDNSTELANPAIYFTGNLNIYKNYGTREPNLFPGQIPIQVLRRKVETNGDDWANLQFKLNNPLPWGDYVAIAEVVGVSGETNWNVFWFNVSDLGLIVKHDSQKLIARAVDLNTLKPVKNVSLSLITESGKCLKASQINNTFASTAANGMLTIAWPVSIKNIAESVLAVAVNNQNRAYASVWSSDQATNSCQHQTYFYTERPIYRLGQTVYFKVIDRDLTADGLRTPGVGRSIKAVIEDPQNNKIWRGSFKTNDHGSFNGLFNIAADGLTGAYQITFTYPDGSTSYGSFEVAQYRKPEYEVTVTPIQKRIIAGEKLKAKIRATYYFGAAVVNAKVKYSVYAANDWQGRYRLMSRPAYYSYFDDWTDDEDNAYSASSGGGDFITEGTAQTDANGEAFIEIETKKFTVPSVADPYNSDYMDKSYRIEAEVTDLSRMSVVSSGSCCVSAGNFALFVEPETCVIPAGKHIPGIVSAINYEGKPVAQQTVTVQLIRWLWDETQHAYTGAKLEEEKTVITDLKGKASFVFDTKNSFPSDTYFVIARAQDSLANAIYDQSSVWIASEHFPYVREGNEAKKQALQVKLDKFAYHPGDIARAVITAPLSGHEGTEALVAIEGLKIHKCWTIPITATATMIEIPIEHIYAPNVYFTVTLVGSDQQFYNQSKIIRISPNEHFLNIAIDTDKKEYKPGQTVQYTLKATDENNHPVPNVELSLGVVDESIYAIRPETAENIQRFFYKKRQNQVITGCTFDEEYSGGPDKMEAVPTVRKDFRDTAAWLPQLKTNSQGIVIASIKLPDNLTTWRATVRGASSNSDFGAAINKIICTQDLIVRLSLPRFFSTGDKSYINTVVHNYTHQSQLVNLTLAASPQFSVHGKLVQYLNILPDKAQRFSWPVTVTGSGLATVMVTAIGKTAADAMESKINIIPLGIPAFRIKGGELVNDLSCISIPLSTVSDAVPDTYKCLLTVAASSIGPVLGNFDKLIDYPYGCTEQTMSRLMPSVVAMTLHKKLVLPIDQKTSDLFAKVYKRSLNRLTDYQHGDGSWGWWQTDAGNPYLTSLVLQGFYRLKQVGYPVDAEQTKKAITWLSKAYPELYKQVTDPKRVHYSEQQKLLTQFEDIENYTDLSIMAYTLSLYDIKTPDNITKWLLTKVQSLPPEALSYLSLALKCQADKRYNISYKQLLAFANKQDNFVEWNHDIIARRMGIPRWLYAITDSARDMHIFDYTNRFIDIETTALALRTVLAIEPDNTTLIEGIKRWLLLQRDDQGWTNTKTTAEVFLALLEEQLSFNTKHDTNETLKIMLDDNLIKAYTFAENNKFAPEEKISFTRTKALSQMAQSPDSSKTSQTSQTLAPPKNPELKTSSQASQLQTSSTSPAKTSPQVTQLQNVIQTSSQTQNSSRTLQSKNSITGTHSDKDAQIAAEIEIGKAKTLKLNKSGPGRLYYNSLITYTHNLRADENIAGASWPNGLSLERSFYSLKTTATTSDGKLRFRSEKITDNTINAGETVLMKIAVNCPFRLPYVILQAYLPSGTEVVENSAKEENIVNDKNASTDDSFFLGDWGNAWWTHKDVLDDRIVFFVTDLPKGKSEFSLLVRMEMPGTYQINPLKLEGMYAKNVRAYSGLGKVKVTE